MGSKFFAILDLASCKLVEITMASDLPIPNAAAQQLIQALGLQAHPEGGFYKETWRSSITLPQGVLPEGYEGNRSAGTSILFLLPTGHCSRWHRVKSAELWFHQAGDPLELRVTENLELRATENIDTETSPIFLGQDFCFQSIVPPNWWQRAKPIAGSAGYSLVGCVVVPGFDFADFELID
jgi:uncharacterized protein